MSLNKYVKIILLIFAVFFVFTPSVSFAKENTQADSYVLKNKPVYSASGAHDESGHEDKHEDKEDAHLSGDHEKLELFHSEYYSMPWRSEQTKKDMWYIIIFLFAVNLFCFVMLIRRLRSRYKVG